jgi:outer membrane protein assembly factor BamB
MLDLLRTITTLPLLILALTAAAQDWSQFRGPTGQGVSEAGSVPTKWGPDENVAWKTKIPGQGWSSPVLAAGKLYLTTALPAEGATPPTLRAICIDATSGQIAWDVEVLRPDSARARQIHKKNSLASPTPVVRDGRLYVHFGHMGSAALDAASGNVVWRQTTLAYPPIHGAGGSPALVDDLLIFTCDGARDPFVAALDAKTGDVRWRTPRRTTVRAPFSFSTPLDIDVAGQKQVVIPGSGLIAAYDPRDGREIWRVTTGEGYSVVPRPAFAHGMIYAATGFDRANLFAIRVEGTKGDVTKSHVAWRLTRNAPLTPSPLVVGDEIYLVSDNGFATCADAKTGKVHWTQRLGGNYSASPVYAAGHVYFQNEEGLGVVVKAAKKFERVAENDLGERTLATYAVAEGSLFIRSAGHLWRIGK